MAEMHELITVAAFGRGLLVAAGAWMALCLVGAAVWPGQRRRLALVCAALGPLVYALWLGYCWTVRVDPQTGYVGLHRVSVFVVDLVAFVVIGAAVGWLIGRMARGGKQAGNGEG
jgi:hypothetical protein